MYALECVRALFHAFCAEMRFKGSIIRFESWISFINMTAKPFIHALSQRTR